MMILFSVDVWTATPADGPGRQYLSVTITIRGSIFPWLDRVAAEAPLAARTDAEPDESKADEEEVVYEETVEALLREQ